MSNQKINVRRIVVSCRNVNNGSKRTFVLNDLPEQLEVH